MKGLRVAASLEYIGSRSERFLGTAPRNCEDQDPETRSEGRVELQIRRVNEAHFDDPFPTWFRVEESEVDGELIQSSLRGDLGKGGEDDVESSERTSWKESSRLVRGCCCCCDFGEESWRTAWGSAKTVSAALEREGKDWFGSRVGEI